MKSNCTFLVFLLVLIWGCTSGRKPVPVVNNSVKADTVKQKDSVAVAPSVIDSSELSEASKLLVQSCDNYLLVDSKTSKAADVLNIKASLFYKNGLLEESRAAYLKIVELFPGTPQSFEAIKMVAQAYYEEKKFEQAQDWYRKLRDMAGEGGDQTEAVARIAESIFRLAEQYENEGRYKDAAQQYEKVALEFPDVQIADVALFNSGLAYEKMNELSQAILIFQRLLQRYPASKLLPKAQFRIARSYEQLKQWDNAAETYLRTAANYPTSELAPTAMNNAGFCFENSGKLREAAATFEKMAQLYPSNEDIADVLFRAGEIYGKVKDWESVSRVTREFSKRYGNDADRVIQALCMMGIALHMQSKYSEALERLESATQTYLKLKDPSPINSFYAAQAHFTIGEIRHEMMKNIRLSLPRDKYLRQIKEKNHLLDLAISAYTKAVKFGILEWTTRSIFQIGQIQEDFAMDVFKQERPASADFEERQVLELSIADAVEKLLEKALHFHEQNVKLGIREKLEDKYVLQSRKKLTMLPCMAAENFLALAEIARQADARQPLSGFALINQKMMLMQKIAPYQNRAIDLYLKSLEMGTIYEERDEFYKQATSRISTTSLSAGEIYADVAMIAREAPVPEKFDKYDKFVYQTKLLTQIEDYENQALDAFLKGLKIAEAYKINDESALKIREEVARLMFVKGRCYDLLHFQLFKNPPYPASANEIEKEEYKLRFEELGVRFGEQALEIYRNVLDYAQKGYASGDYVNHAYVRLFQENPQEYGVKKDTLVELQFKSGPQWKISNDSSLVEWQLNDFSDSAWQRPQKVYLKTKLTEGDSTGAYPPMWFGSGNSEQLESYKPEKKLFFRRPFSLQDVPYSAQLTLFTSCNVSVFVNGESVKAETALPDERRYNLMGKVRKGNNVLAISSECGSDIYGLLPHLKVLASSFNYVPKSPVSLQLSSELVRPGVYKFPTIKNFDQEN